MHAQNRKSTSSVHDHTPHGLHPMQPRSRKLLALLLATLVFGCGPSDPEENDGGVADASVTQDAEPEDAQVSPLPRDPNFVTDYEGVGDQYVTTLTETYAPEYGWEPYIESGVARVPVSEFGRMPPQPGEPHLLRDQLALPSVIDWTAGALPETARSAHFSFVIGDPQIVDQNSPSLAAKNDTTGLGAFRPWGEMIPHILDSLLRTASAYHARRSLDSILIVGDAIENAQANELEWFFTLMNGGTLSSNSGPRDDVIPGPNNDAFDPFVAAGAPPVPWFSVMGNHDLLINGNFPPGMIAEYNNTPEAFATITRIASLFGIVLPQVGTADTHSSFYAAADRPIFNVDPNNFALDQLPLSNRDFTSLSSASITPDPGRSSLDVCSFAEAHRNDTGSPVGHGYGATDPGYCDALRAMDPTGPVGGWYTYDLNAGIRIIALALGPVEGGSDGIFARPPEGCTYEGTPCYGDPRFDQIAFLETELARAQSDQVAVLVYSHQSSGDLLTEPELTAFRGILGTDPLLNEIWERWIPVPNEPMTTEEFRQLLSNSGVVIGHAAGHNHTNQVRAICPDGTHRDGMSEDRCTSGASGQTGYWEFTTVGPVDLPHQARFMEIVHVEEGAGAIYLTNVDARMSAGSFTELARFTSRAWDAAKGGEGVIHMGQIEDRNVLLPFTISPEIEATWQAVEMNASLASETTLTEPAGSTIMHPQWPE